MLQAFFHAWERHLASVSKDRVVRPFEWGLDWIPANGLPHDTAPERVLQQWVDHVMEDTDALFHARSNRRLHVERGSRRRRPHAVVSVGVHDAASREQHGVLPAGDAFAEAAHARGGAGAAAMERRLGRTRRPVPAAGDERDDGAAPQPAVSRSADAAGTAARRLHRQLQRRAHGPGLPAGGARRPPGDRLAGAAGIRSHRDPRDQPRVVPVAADHRARAAHRGAGAESHLAALRGRGLARHLDAPRPRRDSTAASTWSGCGICGNRSARTGTWNACATARRCSSTRGTT